MPIGSEEVDDSEKFWAESPGCRPGTGVKAPINIQNSDDSIYNFAKVC